MQHSLPDHTCTKRFSQVEQRNGEKLSKIAGQGKQDSPSARLDLQGVVVRQSAISEHSKPSPYPPRRGSYQKFCNMNLSVFLGPSVPFLALTTGG